MSTATGCKTESECNGGHKFNHISFVMGLKICLNNGNFQFLEVGIRAAYLYSRNCEIPLKIFLNIDIDHS